MGEDRRAPLRSDPGRRAEADDASHTLGAPGGEGECDRAADGAAGYDDTAIARRGLEQRIDIGDRGRHLAGAARWSTGPRRACRSAAPSSRYAGAAAHCPSCHVFSS
jgi:hypothetical protein